MQQNITVNYIALRILGPSNCAECGGSIANQGFVQCLSCKKPCEPFAQDKSQLENSSDGEMVALNVKSKCCKADVRLMDIRNTCSDKCNEITFKKLEDKIGEFIYDTDAEGIVRKIPLSDIYYKRGLTMEELRSYPKADISGNS